MEGILPLIGFRLHADNRVARLKPQRRRFAFALLSELTFPDHRPVNWLPCDFNERMTGFFHVFLGALLIAMKLAAGLRTAYFPAAQWLRRRKISQFC